MALAVKTTNQAHFLSCREDPHTADGIAFIGHEVKHVEQQSKGFFKFLGNYISDVLDAIEKNSETSQPGFHGGVRITPKKSIWEIVADSHDSIRAEREAIDFQNKIREEIKQKHGNKPCP